MTSHFEHLIMQSPIKKPTNQKQKQNKKQLRHFFETRGKNLKYIKKELVERRRNFNMFLKPGTMRITLLVVNKCKQLISHGTVFQTNQKTFRHSDVIVQSLNQIKREIG